MANHAVTTHTIPCLSDNYAFLVHDYKTGTAAVVDVPEAKPLLAKIEELDVVVTEIFLTHHHQDHIDGLEHLKKQLSNRQDKLTVIGAKADAHRLPELDIAVVPNQNIKICGMEAKVLDVSGHTIGHIALHLPEINVLFSGDSLMAMGCGRLFEGSAAQMWHSLKQLRSLPDSTNIYSGHEYTEANMKFAESLGDQNSACFARVQEIKTKRAAGIPTVPSNLGIEKRTNPFLRPDNKALQAAIGMSGESSVNVFTEIRKRKDNF